ERSRARAPGRSPSGARRASRRHELRSLQVHRLRADRALDRKGLRHALSPDHRESGRSAEHRLGGSEPLVCSALLPAAAPSGGDDPVVNVLVTGGAGFIGSHVVDLLYAYGYMPRVFDIVPPSWDNGYVEWVVGDLLDGTTLARAMTGCDAVIHLAAVADVGA